MMTGGIAILGVGRSLPAARSPVHALFAAERVPFSDELARRIGAAEVCVSESQPASYFALEAAREAVRLAGIDPKAIDILVDYSVLPPEFLPPAWNMGNKLQKELGATKSFTIGFSGAGATSVLVALDYAAATLGTDPSIRSILLFGADVTIPGNRVLNTDEPLTVLGDGATAIVVGRLGEDNAGSESAPEAHGPMILACRLSSNGANHDVFRIPGGGMTHPTRVDLYRVVLESAKIHQSGRFEALAGNLRELLHPFDLPLSRISHVLYPNFSAEDRASWARHSRSTARQMEHSVLSTCGHVPASDLALNLAALRDSGAARKGDYTFLLSDGLGFTAGAMLLRH